jgi:hypothetical protein
MPIQAREHSIIEPVSVSAPLTVPTNGERSPSCVAEPAWLKQARRAHWSGRSRSERRPFAAYRSSILSGSGSLPVTTNGGWRAG